MWPVCAQQTDELFFSDPEVNFPRRFNRRFARDEFRERKAREPPALRFPAFGTFVLKVGNHNPAVHLKARQRCLKPGNRSEFLRIKFLEFKT